MQKSGNKLCCKACGGEMHGGNQSYACLECSVTYPVEEGIVVIERGEEVDLRIGEKMLDLYKLRLHKRYFDQIIDSEVEFIGRIHSVAFSEFHAELLRPVIEGKVIADLGCGQLPYIHAFSSSGLKEYYAFDLSRESLDIARRNYRGSFPLHLVQCGLKKVPFPADSIDAIVSSEVIEHLERPMEYLQEIHRICKTGGYLSISTPCISMYLYPHNFFGLLKNPLSVKQWWRQLNAHKDWKTALSWHPALRPSVLRSWMEKAGFKIIRQETRLWYYGTPLQPAWRFFKLLERAGVKTAGAIFDRYLKMTDKLLRAKIPVLRWAGIRQFALCQK